ncbi:MAG: D-alanine--poly(phosphoribitol) ligase subunit 2 [Spirochaetia bacterium]|nr:D-alanine--poly(phosphoribitol) ligase subunit 2 [Spirochaetia bacterium]
MIDVQKLLYDICEDKRVYEDGIDLIDSGILDSYAFIELFSRLEDYGIILHPTRIDRTKLHTVHGIEELISMAQQQA